MSGQRRMPRHNKVYHVTNRTRSGLPFVPNKFIEGLIGGIISRAAELYLGVEINAVLFMGNHYHIILAIVGDPVHLSRFMCYFQSELSGIIHRLTGVCNESLWAGKYKSSELLTADVVMDKLRYLYLNPVKANLVERAKDWEGLSSWHELNGGEHRQFKWISDSHVKRLPRGNFSDRQIEDLLEETKKEGRGYRDFNINPFSWKKLFKETKSRSNEDLYQELMSGIEEEEDDLIEKREQGRKTVFGATKLRYQSIYRNYKPKKFGKTPTSLSTCQLATKIFKETYKDFKEKCLIAYCRWKSCLSRLELPPGAFYPPLTPMASALE